MTNYEQMKTVVKETKSMTIWEVVDFLYRTVESCGCCPAFKRCEYSKELSCKERLYDWLESEAEENMLPEICSCGYRFVADETICPNCGKKVEDDERTFEE